MTQKMPSVKKQAQEAATLNKILEQAVEGGIFTRAFAACGSIDSEELTLSAVVGSPSQWFDLASLTKALVTVPAIFSLGIDNYFLQRSLGDLYGARRSVLPEGLRGLSLASLLSHRSGLSPWCSFWIRSDASASTGWCSEEEVQERISYLPFQAGGEKSYSYSDIGFILLAFGLEHYTGVKLSTYFYQLQEKCVDGRESMPIRFTDRFDGIGRGDFVSSGYCRVRKRLLQGEVHDENAWCLGGVAGHAGAFSTGEGLCDYVRGFARSQLGARVIASNAALRRQGDNRGLLGWQQGSFGGGQCFGGGMGIGHLGFTGTTLWYLPETRQYGVLLTNRVAGGRTAKLEELGELRKKVFTLFNRILV
jgi:CubicO group peptidase (beta-lactamase class C family)